jgi:hypothetical protein
LSSFPVNLQKDRLCEILGLGGIPQDVQRRYMHQSVISFENNGERVRIARLKFLHNALVTERQHVAVQDTRARIAGHWLWKKHGMNETAHL